MTRLLALLGASALVLGGLGCRSNPYCLNCKDSGNGVITADLSPPADLSGPGDDLAGVMDMSRTDGPCVPTNGGVEICDGRDNDCNGKIDDVDPSKLVGDPHNCGACGNSCNFLATHQFGACIGDFSGGGKPTCAPTTCIGGYVDADHDPKNGCEYACTPTNPPTEVCDGKDNDCNGKIDDPFTTSYAADGTPLYDSDAANCGRCGTVCRLGAGTVMKCGPGAAAGSTGVCQVDHCVNVKDTDTWRHDPSTGDINATGCEYHCPVPSHTATTGSQDCEADGSCVFDPEICDGKDNDCDFKIDEDLNDPRIGQACGQACPGGVLANCKGECRAGATVCSNGAPVCMGSTGPSVETCDGKDNDCDGLVDQPFTAPGAAGFADGAAGQHPLYNSDVNHCGSCTAASCGLANAVNGCHSATAGQVGACFVQACNPGWNYVGHTDSNAGKPTCDVTTAKPRDSTPTATGAGCFYQCPLANNGPEVCDGKDNDCDGCIDNGLTQPANFCANKGVCAGRTIPIVCAGAAGFRCDYSGVPNVSVDANGNLTATEPQCDGLDNNCNGPCDENFPHVGVAAGSCTNPRTAATCTAGLGVCQATASYQCVGGTAEACNAVPNIALATDEKCDGKDNDCDGQIDEPNDSVLAGKTFKGWHDPTVKVAVPADPSPGGAAAHTVWVYQFEATRTDASGVSPGGANGRACANSGVLPWSSVTQAQAQAACAAVHDPVSNTPGRLCTAWEWQTACLGPGGSAGKHWSLSATPASYVSGVCNDVNETEQRCMSAAQCKQGCNANGVCTCSGNGDCNPGFACTAGVCVGKGAWATGSSGTTTAQTCSVAWPDGAVRDLSGNLMEWTATSVSPTATGGVGLTAGPVGRMRLTGVSAVGSDVGAALAVSGASNAANNGTFVIAAVNGDGTVDVNNAAVALPDANGTANKLSAAFVYNKIRGGAYNSPQDGSTCEFDFDIQKASFANTNVGFRCCFDAAP